MRYRGDMYVHHFCNLAPCSMPESTSEGLASFPALELLWHPWLYSLRPAPLTTVITTKVTRHCQLHLGGLVRTTSLEINSYKEKEDVKMLKGGWGGNLLQWPQVTFTVQKKRVNGETEVIVTVYNYLQCCVKLSDSKWTRCPGQHLIAIIL